MKDQLKGSSGHYWDNDLKRIANSSKTPEVFQKRLLTWTDDIEYCTVCARGAMMLSQIRLGNEVDPVKSYWSCDEGNEEIIKGFSMDDFENMEQEYEDCEFEHPYEDNTTEKLKNICLNILVNGNFNTEDQTDYLKDYENK